MTIVQPCSSERDQNQRESDSKEKVSILSHLALLHSLQNSLLTALDGIVACTLDARTGVASDVGCEPRDAAAAVALAFFADADDVGHVPADAEYYGGDGALVVLGTDREGEGGRGAGGAVAKEEGNVNQGLVEADGCVDDCGGGG